MAAVRVGRRAGGGGWQRAALDPDAPAAQLLLAELIGALERRGLAYVDPFSINDVLALANYGEAREALWTLFDRAPQHFRLLAGTSNRSRRSGDPTGWWHVLEGSTSWARRLGGWPEYFVRDDDWWRGDQHAMDTPCVVAGYTFEAPAASALLAADTQAWRDRLAGQQIDIFADGQHVRCVRPLYLSQLVTAGVTLDDQAKALAAWIEQSITLIDENAPPALGFGAAGGPSPTAAG